MQPNSQGWEALSRKACGLQAARQAEPKLRRAVVRCGNPLGPKLWDRTCPVSASGDLHGLHIGQSEEYGLPACGLIRMLRDREERIGQPPLGENQPRRRTLGPCFPPQPRQPCVEVIEASKPWGRTLRHANSAEGDREMSREIVTLQITVPNELCHAPLNTERRGGPRHRTCVVDLTAPRTRAALKKEMLDFGQGHRLSP